MKLQIHYRDRSGFTLIEIMVVIAIVGVIIASGLFLNLRNFFGYSLNNERDTLVWALIKARSQAMSNVCLGDSCTGGLPHGVYIEYDSDTKFINKYIIFQGYSYSPGNLLNQEIRANYSVRVHDEEPDFISEVIFSQLSGQTDVPGEIASLTLGDQTGHSYTVVVSSEGRIDY